MTNLFDLEAATRDLPLIGHPEIPDHACGQKVIFQARVLDAGERSGDAGFERFGQADYTASTCFTSGTISRSRLSIPCFRVTDDAEQP